MSSGSNSSSEDSSTASPVSSSSGSENAEADIFAANRNNTTVRAVVTRRRKNAKPKKREHALREIRKLQATTDLLVPRAPFLRVVHEILRKNTEDGRIAREAVEALRESTEMFAVQLFEDAFYCALHSGRITVMPRDFHLVSVLKPFD